MVNKVCKFTGRECKYYKQEDKIFRYISNKMQHLFLENCTTRFGWYLHPPSGAHITVFTASGTCQTVTATCRYCGRVGTGLSVVWELY